MRTEGWTLGLALLAGCASSAPDLSATDQATQEVLGQPATWVERPGEEPPSIEAAVRQLLGRDLSPDDAIRVALLRNMELQALYEELGIAEAELLQASLPRNPTFDAEVKQPDVRPGGTALELEFAQDVLSLLMIPGRRAVAEARLEQTRALVMAHVVELAADVRVAYYSLQGALEARAVADRARATATASLEYARALHRVGNLTDKALVIEEAQAAQALVDRRRLELAVIDARERLTGLMGVWGVETAWSIPARLPEPARDEPTLETLESLAVARRFDLLAARAAIEAAARSLELASSYRWTPGVRVGVAADRDTDGSWAIGPAISLSLPLFDQGQADVARLLAQLRQAEKRFAALAVDVRAEVRRWQGRLVALAALVRGYQDELMPARRGVVARTLEQYNFMLAGTFELLAAKRDELSAEQGRVEALRDYWIARGELARTLGGRLPDGQPVDARGQGVPGPQPAPTPQPTAPGPGGPTQQGSSGHGDH
jgi:outer membrane protein, heavy metal efflux system